MPAHGDDSIDELLAEQRAFYRARAPEYDDWWRREGLYDRGPEHTAAWDAQVDVLEAALAAFGATGDVLELAGGTGWWTKRLADTARSLTVVDASPETLELNRARVARPDTTYVVADLFDWRPDRHYDQVFFSFWLSHVPRVRFGEFWQLVRSCLAPGGRVFLIDNRHDPTMSTSTRDPFVTSREADQQRRRLTSGDEYRVVKIMYEPDELAAAIAAEGWDVTVYGTPWFVYATATPQG